MIIPERLEYLTEYIVKIFSSDNQRISPPMILQGEYGTGKSWVLKQVFERIKLSSNETMIIPLQIPIQFSGIYLIDDIVHLMDVARKKFYMKQNIHQTINHKLKYLLVLENIDRLFDFEIGEKGFSFPLRAKGAGVSKINYIQQSSRLRSFLIENSSTVSLLATAVKLDFMRDHELPFYNYFNVLRIDPLGRKESMDYVLDKIDGNNNAIELFDIFLKQDIRDFYEITDGILGYLNLYVGTLHEIANIAKNKNLKELVDRFDSIYFTKLNPHIEGDLSQLSFNEKVMVDCIARIRRPFRVSDLHTSGLKNNSREVSSLKEKGILSSRGTGRTSTYEFASKAMEKWIQYNLKVLAIY